MALSAGGRPGQYRIPAPIGAADMGEVYRAADTRLGRHPATNVVLSAVVGKGIGVRK